MSKGIVYYILFLNVRTVTKMKEFPKISDAELQVMKVLWEENSLTSIEIIEVVGKNNTWSPKTVHTLISRLVKKGVVEVEKKKTGYEYKPVVSQNEMRKKETKSFLQRIYDGSVHLLLSNFLAEEELTQEEIKELQNILKEKSR